MIKNLVSTFLCCMLLAIAGCSNPISSVTGKPDEKEITKETKAELLNNSGLQAGNRGDYAFAVLKFKEAVAVDEKPQYLSNLGRSFYMLGKYSESLAAFNRAEELGLKNAGLKANIGDVFRQRGDYTEAIKYYHQSLNLEPNYARAHYELGNLYLKQGDYATAEQRINRALQIDPSFTRAILARAILYRLTKRYDKAYADMRLLEKRGFEVKEELRRDIIEGLQQMRAAGAKGGETL